QNWASKLDMFSSLPRHSGNSYDPKSFYDRTVNFLQYFGGWATMKVVDPLFVHPAVERMGARKGFSMDGLYAEAAYTQYDGIERLGWPIPSAPGNPSTGYNCEPLGELDEEYRFFVEDPNSKGTIYIAFGTSVDWNLAPEEIREMFFEAINELTDYRIVFSYKGPRPKVLGKHVKLTAWAPQLDLLAHPKTKVFLTHSGLKSLREALCTKTPVVLMPMFAEQSHNAKFALSLGIGTVLNKFTITKERIVAELVEVLENPKYEVRVSKLYDIFLDRPMPALDEAVFYATRQMRYKDRQVFFKRRAIQQTLVEYHNLDLIAGVLAVVYFLSR
ncbi:Protein UGT-64, partial [Aphelenchoides avenae]